MRIQINRFEVVDIDNRSGNKVGIKDHATDKTVVLLNMFEKQEDNVSLGEDIISVIENHLEQSENNDNEG